MTDGNQYSLDREVKTAESTIGWVLLDTEHRWRRYPENKPNGSDKVLWYCEDHDCYWYGWGSDNVGGSSGGVYRKASHWKYPSKPGDVDD